MNIFENIFKWWFKKVPGFVSAILVFTFIYNQIFGEVEILSLVLIYSLTLIIYYSAGLLDKPFYGSIFGIKSKPIFNKIGINQKINQSRNSARNKFGSSFNSSEGIYVSCKMIMNNSEKWDKEIKPYLEISKVSRCFVAISIVLIPVTLVLKIFNLQIPYSVIPDYVQQALFDLEINIPVLLMSYLIFAYFRHKHQLKLYDGVEELEFEIYDFSKSKKNEILNSQEFLFINDKFIKWDTLPIIKNNKGKAAPKKA